MTLILILRRCHVLVFAQCYLRVTTVINRILWWWWWWLWWWWWWWERPGEKCPLPADGEGCQDPITEPHHHWTDAESRRQCNVCRQTVPALIQIIALIAERAVANGVRPSRAQRRTLTYVGRVIDITERVNNTSHPKYGKKSLMKLIRHNRVRDVNRRVHTVQMIYCIVSLPIISAFVNLFRPNLGNR